jgi:hypothetical protein
MSIPVDDSITLGDNAVDSSAVLWLRLDYRGFK